MPPTNGPQLRTTVTVIAGETSVPVMHLPWGSNVGPLGVGAFGDWAIRGEGVLDVHILLSFDGQRVHVAPARAMNYVAVNGQVIDERWWAVPVHSEIQFGSVVLRIGCEEIADPAGDSPQEDPMTSTVPDGGRLRRYAEGLREQPGAPFESPEFVTDARGNPQVAPAARTSSPPPVRPGEAPTPRPAAGSPPPERSPGTPAPATASRGFGASWRKTSLPMKLTLFLLPLAAAGILYTWDDPPASEPVRRAPKKIAASPGKAGVSATPAASLAPAPMPPSETASATPRPQPSVSVMVLEIASAAPLTSAKPPVTARLPAPAAPLTGKPPTSNVARAALEAAFAGQLGPAQDLYERLAAQYPEEPVFRSAADHVKAGTVRKP